MVGTSATSSEVQAEASSQPHRRSASNREGEICGDSRGFGTQGTSLNRAVLPHLGRVPRRHQRLAPASRGHFNIHPREEFSPHCSALR